MQNVLITGGAGYVGHLLAPRLLSEGYHVTVYDQLYFGCRLPNSPNLRVVQGDIRDTAQLADALAVQDAVLHLACISNDASFELDEKLSETINYDCFEPMVLAAKAARVKRFVYCSSSSVYGVSDKPDVTEDHPLVPLTLYNKYKGLCEPLLFRHQAPGFTCVTIRPATICGYGPRMRLELSVNILTNLAVNSGKITVFGGAQLRPNLHIQDMADVYQLMIEAPAEKIAGQIFNIGYQNLAIARIAEIVREVVEREFPERAPIRIETTSTNDPRSYHINSDKIKRVLGYAPRHTVEDAVRDLCRAPRSGPGGPRRLLARTGDLLLRGRPFCVPCPRPGGHRPLDRAPARLHGHQRTGHGARPGGGPPRRRRQARLCGVLVLLRPGRRADARRSSDCAPVSVRALEVLRRGGGPALEPGVPAAGELDPDLQRLRHSRADDRGLRRRLRRVLQAEAGRKAVHGGRRRHPAPRFHLRHRRRAGLPARRRDREDGGGLEPGRGQSQIGRASCRERV